MAGTKLRGARLDAFNALGQRGKPIYSVAPQILSVLGRHEAQHAGLAGLFAIPQANEDGSGLDWYAPEQGPVIAWSAATSQEKHAAYARLSLAQQQIEQLRTHYAGSANDDAKLLSQLLEWVMYYPDDSHLFLVNDQPVISFWGFLLDGADRSIAPLHSLASQLKESNPPAPPPEPDTAPDTATTTTPLMQALPANQAPTPVELDTKRRWPWWLWLLLLLLLIPLLLWLLRGCIPAAAVPTNATEQGYRTEQGPRQTTLVPTQSAQALSPIATSPSALAMPHGTAAGLGSANALVPPPEGAAVQAFPSTPNATEDNNLSSDVPAQTPQPTPEVLPAPSAQAPLEGETAPAEGTTAAPPFLAVPPELADGPADFLQGGWQANSGIQDRDTGVPLKLRYEFNGGKGHAVLTGSNGVTCTAPVAANMQSHNLHITPDAAAACNDGSTYELPLVECLPNAIDPSAACSGQYGERNFPLYMRQPR